MAGSVADQDATMASDCCDTSDSDEFSPSENKMEEEARSSTSGRRTRHTPAQLATLNAYFKFDMVGVGKNYLAMIAAASKDSNLSEEKVKVNYCLLVILFYAAVWCLIKLLYTLYCTLGIFTCYISITSCYIGITQAFNISHIKSPISACVASEINEKCIVVC